jgi:hypothetical protein
MGTANGDRPLRTGICPHQLENAFTLGVLGGEKKGLNQFAFAASDHPWKTLVPFSFGNLGLTVQPPGK